MLFASGHSSKAAIVSRSILFSLQWEKLMSSVKQTDVAVIGGGYYGALVANEIKDAHRDIDVMIIEKESELFTKASSTNQGQFHMGYMYSADPELARECVENIQEFSDTFGDAVDHEVESLYGIHRDSQISAEDYAHFCENAGLALQDVGRPAKIFGAAITATFASAEKTFNSAVIQKIFRKKLERSGVELSTGFAVAKITQGCQGLRVVATDDRIVDAKTVFNVTFADINGLHERSELPKIPLQHDTFLHFVLDLPKEYKMTAATVIRGPYASLLPSDYRSGHVLASGKFRKIYSATMDRPSEEINDKLARAIYGKVVKETTDYMPVLAQAKYRGYTVGTRSAHFSPSTGAYTSKAMVFNNFGGIQNYHVVLGGKVSCMFDVVKKVRDIIG
jgi:glycine/D-amino acid oxidase-like deaminating enzyme